MKRAWIVLVTALALAACGGNSDDGKGEAATSKMQPKTLAGAKAVARESADRFAAQDYAGSWDLFDKNGKSKVNRDEYVKYATACDLGGVPLKIEDIRLEGGDKAVVRYEALGFKQARTIIYESGQWRAQTTQDTIDRFSGGSKTAIAAAKDEGSC